MYICYCLHSFSPDAGYGQSLLCIHFSSMRIKIACKSSTMAHCQNVCTKRLRRCCAEVLICVFYLYHWSIYPLRAGIVSDLFFTPRTKNNILHTVYAKYSMWAEYFRSVGFESSFKEKLANRLWAMMTSVEQCKGFQSSYYKHSSFFSHFDF